MAKRDDDIPICQRAALHYANPNLSYGWKIFPARMEGGKKYSWLSAEHAPGGENWGMTNDLALLRKNFNNPRWRLKCGVGLPTGAVNRIFICETDTIKGHGVDGAKALRELERKHGKLPKTLMARSPTGSVHRYFKHPGDIKLRSMTIAAGVDVKADGGMVIAPPSVRAEGAYEWVDNTVEIADAPAWLIELLKEEERHSGNGYDANDPYEHAAYEPLTEDEKTAACVAIRDHLPNQDDDWDTWNTNGMKIWHTAPDERGLEAFDGYSQRSGKYDEEATRKKWQAFFKSPPTNISQGSFVYLANEADPTWRDQIEEEEPEPKAKTNGSTAPANDPVDLWDAFPTPPLPRGVLPSIIEKFALAHSKLMGSDPAGFAMGALVACAAVIPDRIKIQPKRHDPWTQSARLWVALVGRASTMKTPIFGVAMRAIERIDNRLMREYMQAKEEWENLEAEEKRETPKPPLTRLKIEDVTIQIVQEIASDSPDGLIMTRDELSSFFGSMELFSGKGKRNVGTDRGFYLQAYEGRSYTFDRIGRGSSIVENLSLNIFGGIQPDLIRKIAWDGFDDGLIERFNMISLRDSEIDQDAPLPSEAKAFDDLIDRLFGLRSKFDVDLVKLDEEAQLVREQARNEYARLVRIFQSVNQRVASHIGKYNGMFARYCLLFHIIENHEEAWQTDVDVDTARRAARFIREFLWPHAIAFYLNVLNVGNEHEQLLSVAGYILAHEETLRRTDVSNRDVQMGTRTMRNLKRKDIEGVFEQLNALGWVKRLPPKRAGDPPRWEVNSRVYELYAERAKEETKHRAEVREAIAEMAFKRKSKANSDNSQSQQ